MVLRNIQVDTLDPLTNGQRPEARNPPGADLVSPPGMAACEIKEPFSTTSLISQWEPSPIRPIARVQSTEWFPITQAVDAQAPPMIS